MQRIHAVLCIVGALLPLAAFVPWLAGHGLDVPLLLQQAVSTPVSAFAWSDVAVSAVVLAVFAMADGSARFIKETVAADVLKALGTRAGGEVVSSDAF